MPSALTREIRSSLAASRGEADRILSDAEARARALSAAAAETDREFAEARLARLAHLRDEIGQHQERIEIAYAAMAEAMAMATLRLAEVARQADFGIPPWPAGIRTAFELKLTETREMTIRIARDTTARAPGAEGSRIAVEE